MIEYLLNKPQKSQFIPETETCRKHRKTQTSGDDAQLSLKTVSSPLIARILPQKR